MSKTFVLAGLLILASCTKDRIRGEGPTTTEDRNVSNFTRVDISGSNKVHITKGAAFRVQLKGYHNLLPYFETEVDGNTLHLQFRGGTNVSNNNVEVFVTMPHLAEVKNSGSGHTGVKGAFTSQRLEASLSGSGKISIEEGTADLFVPHVSGSGSLHAFGLLADKAEVSLSGSGTTEVSVVTHLKANVSGSGAVFYKGSPGSVESIVTGSGRVVRKD